MGVVEIFIGSVVWYIMGFFYFLAYGSMKFGSFEEFVGYILQCDDKAFLKTLKKSEWIALFLAGGPIVWIVEFAKQLEKISKK